jgi:hypothetical protein
MGLFDFFNGGDASGRDFVYNMDPNSEQHKSKLSHELIGGAAGFEAMRAYEQHCSRNGQPPNVSQNMFRVQNSRALAGKSHAALSRWIWAGQAQAGRIAEHGNLGRCSREGSYGIYAL